MIGCNKHNIQTPSDIKQDTPSFNNDYLYDEIYEIRGGTKEVSERIARDSTKAWRSRSDRWNHGQEV